MLRTLLKLSNYMFLFVYLVLGTWTGCSQVSFTEAPKPACNGFDQVCIQENIGDKTYNVFDYSETVPQPQVDILFVDDNSNSMSLEQQKMGDRFPNFLSSISGLDWRIAVTTTDITPSGQGGSLLEFTSGLRILTPSTPNSETLFRNTIQRSEVGNGDERGIFAANLVVDRQGQTQFFRPEAHFAIVILSDEDERSFGGTQSAYPLENYDRPESLRANVSGKLGRSKTLSAHSVIIRPGDTACKQIQDGQTNIGQYGTIYAQLSNLTQGVIGDICASDYGAQLTSIGGQIARQISSIKLACSPVTGAGLDPIITIAPQTNPATNGTIRDDQIFFDQPLPVGTTVMLKYRCLVR